MRQECQTKRRKGKKQKNMGTEYEKKKNKKMRWREISKTIEDTKDLKIKKKEP